MRVVRRLDRYQAQWPELFAGLEQWQIRVVVQRLENAALEGLVPTRADVAAILAAVSGICERDAYVRAVMLFPLRPAPDYFAPAS